MAVTLLATQVPTPQQYSGFLRLIDGYTAGGNAINAENVAAGDTTDALKKLNRNATQQDLASRYGGGLYAVAYGLTLSIGTGLQVNVAAGHAVMDGIVEVPANTSVNIDPSISRAHIWLLRTGAFEVVNNSLTPPATPAVYIGSCVSGASTITSVDASGIPTLIGGIVIRQTADPAAPGDTPSSSTAFFTRTSGGLYLWDGSAYYGISAGSVPTLFDWKNSVRVVSTSNITLSGTQTIDGVALSVGDRVLVAGQTTGANNGIYTVASGAWSRATDADASAEVTAGMIVPVTEGTTYADTLWCLTTNDTITLGSTTLTFALISANFTALAGNGLSASGAGLAVNVDGSTLEINADTLRIKDGGVTLAKHANMATDRLLGRDTAGSGAPEELTVGGGLEFSGSGGIQRSALTGHVTAPAGSNSTTIANSVVTEAMLNLTDLTTGNATSSAHGFLKKLSNNAYDVMGGDGNWKPMLLLLASNRGSVTGGALAAGTTRYCSPVSAVLYETTQANAEIKIPRAGRIKYLRVFVSANAISAGTATVKVMINGSVASAPNLSFNSGSGTGWFADDSTEINVSAGDLITLELVGATTGSITFTATIVGLMES